MRYPILITSVTSERQKSIHLKDTLPQSFLQRTPYFKQGSNLSLKKMFRCSGHMCICVKLTKIQ